MMKNKGVSMIELVIVIILLIMIAVFAIFSTKTTNLKAEATALYAEMKNLKTGVMVVYQDYSAGIIDTYEVAGKYYNTTLVEDDGEKWYVICGIGSEGETDEEKYMPQVIEKLNIDELKRTYLVKFDTAEVKLQEPVKIGEYKIETYKDIETVIESGAI